MRLPGVVTYCSLVDEASVNLSKYLGLETKVGRYETYYGEHVCVDGEFLYLEPVKEKYPIVFLSRHESSSRYPALTVHATGNFGDAPYGGFPNKISISFPILAGTIIRRLFSLAPSGYHVNYEVTHHGPLVETPHVFAEIGSSSVERNDKEAIEALGEAIGKILEELRLEEIRSSIGIGGPHYAPTFTRLSREEAVGFGHIIPKRSMKSEPRLDRVDMALERTRPRVDLVILDRKGMNGKRRQAIRAHLEKKKIKREKRRLLLYLRLPTSMEAVRVIPEEYHEQIVEMFRDRIGEKEVKVKLLLREGHEDSELLLKLMQELHELYDKVQYEVLYEDEEEAKRLIEEKGIKILPVLFFTENSFFEGLPLGHESAVVLEMLGVLANPDTAPYNEELREKLNDGCGRDIRIYVTMACPYCPMASFMALSIPILYPEYISRVYVLDSRPEVGEEENVDAVPHMIVKAGDCKDTFIGLPPVEDFVERVTSCRCRRL